MPAKQRDTVLTSLDPQCEDSAEKFPVLLHQAVVVQVCLEQGHGPGACVEGMEGMQGQGDSVATIFFCPTKVVTVDASLSSSHYY